jgi:glyoxylase I family protein
LLQLPNPDAAAQRPEHGGRDRHVAFVVDDLQGLQTRLDVAGVPYTRSRSGRAALFCRDPDGNALEWIQREAP